MPFILIKKQDYFFLFFLLTRQNEMAIKRHELNAIFLACMVCDKEKIASHCEWRLTMATAKKMMTNEMATEMAAFLSDVKKGVVGARCGARIPLAKIKMGADKVVVEGDEELDWEVLPDEIVEALSVVEDSPNETLSSLCLIYQAEMDVEIGYTDGRLAAWRKLGGYHLEDGEGFYIPTRLCKAIAKWGKYGVKMAATDEGMVFVVGEMLRVDATACPHWDCGDNERTGGWKDPKGTWEELRYKSAPKMFMDAARLPIAMPSRKDSYPKGGMLHIADNGLWVKIPKKRVDRYMPSRLEDVRSLKQTDPITYVNADGSKDAAEGVATLRIEDAVAASGMFLDAHIYTQLAIFSGYGLGAPLFLNPNVDAGYSTLGDYIGGGCDDDPDDDRGNLGYGVAMWMVGDKELQKTNVVEAEENAAAYRNKIKMEEEEKVSAAEDDCEIALTTRKEADVALADAKEECYRSRLDRLKVKYHGDFSPIENMPSVDSELYAALYKDVAARDKVDGRKDVHPDKESDANILMFEDKIAYITRGMYFAAERRDAPVDIADGEQIEIPRGLLRGMATCGGEIGICNLAEPTEDSYRTRGWMVWQLGSYMQVGIAFGMGRNNIMTVSLRDIYEKWHASTPAPHHADALLGIVANYGSRLKGGDVLLVMPSGNVFASDWGYHCDKTIYIGKVEALAGMARPYAVQVGYLKTMSALCATQYGREDNNIGLRLGVHLFDATSDGWKGTVDRFTIEVWNEATNEMVDGKEVPFTCGCCALRAPGASYMQDALADAIVCAMRTVGIDDDAAWATDVAAVRKWGQA